uniref:transposase n=1 Tax=Sphingomonas bacterium TaxID=1895847 RepID=UPI00345C5075
MVQGGAHQGQRDASRPDPAQGARAADQVAPRDGQPVAGLTQAVRPAHGQGDDAGQADRAVPSVGPIIALSYKSSIEDPGRFARGEDAGAYAGLVPRRSQSGERDTKGRISKAGDPMLRSALYEAANNVAVISPRPRRR